MATIILTKDLLKALIEYMNEEKCESLEFDEHNFMTQIKAYNERVFGTVMKDDGEQLH